MYARNLYAHIHIGLERGSYNQHVDSVTTTDVESAESQLFLSLSLSLSIYIYIVIPYQTLALNRPITALHIDSASNNCWKYDELHSTC